MRFSEEQQRWLSPAGLALRDPDDLDAPDAPHAPTAWNAEPGAARADVPAAAAGGGGSGSNDAAWKAAGQAAAATGAAAEPGGGGGGARAECSERLRHEGTETASYPLRVAQRGPASAAAVPLVVLFDRCASRCARVTLWHSLTGERGLLCGTL